MKRLGSLLLALFSVSCTGMPDGVTPVEDFELSRYLGTWYEIARLDHSFERGLSQVSAKYVLNDDGTVKLTNRGYLADKGKWREAHGKVKFVGDTDVGHLQASFFGPFYSSYLIFGLDQEDYQYAFVSGHKHKYLWFLARTPIVSDSLKEQFVERASGLGFDTDALIWVEQLERQ